VLSSDFEYVPKSTVLVEGGGGDAADKFDAIYDALEGCDDVQTVFHNVEFQY
jgi:transcriptional/translational regulatory protein YebC/TACO1